MSTAPFTHAKTFPTLKSGRGFLLQSWSFLHTKPKIGFKFLQGVGQCHRGWTSCTARMKKVLLCSSSKQEAKRSPCGPGLGSEQKVVSLCSLQKSCLPTPGTKESCQLYYWANTCYRRRSRNCFTIIFTEHLHLNQGPDLHLATVWEFNICFPTDRVPYLTMSWNPLCIYGCTELISLHILLKHIQFLGW